MKLLDDSRSPGHPLVAALMLGVPMTTACTSAPPSPTLDDAVVTEVDGVRVVDNVAPSWQEGEGWSISAEPTVTLGVDVGPPPEMFSSYVFPPFSLGDGRVVVPDRENELRVFDADGAYLETLGREGEGPCEFVGLRGAYPARDDSIAAWDWRIRRVVVFGSGGECRATLSLEGHDEPYGSAIVEGRFGDGTLLAMAYDPLPDGVAGTRVWRQAAFFRYAADGTDPRLLAELPILEAIVRTEMSVVFSAVPFVVAHGDHLYHAPGDTTEVRVHDLEGNLVQRFRRRHEPRPVTQADRDAWTETSRRNVDTEGSEFARRMFDLAVFAEAMPAVRGLLVDELGNVWVERHLGLVHERPIMIGDGRATWEGPDASTWDVFTPGGIWLGPVELVAGREPTYIGADHVLMRGQDAAGVTKVWKYALRKPR